MKCSTIFEAQTADASAKCERQLLHDCVKQSAFADEMGFAGLDEIRILREIYDEALAEAGGSRFRLFAAHSAFLRPLPHYRAGRQRRGLSHRCPWSVFLCRGRHVGQSSCAIRAYGETAIPHFRIVD